MSRRLKRSKKPALLSWFLLTTPIAASGEVWERLTRYQQHRYPVRYWLQNDLRIWFGVQRHRLRDKIAWVRCRTIERNHIIKVKSLGPGYYDTDQILLHAAFDIFRKHFETTIAAKNYEWVEKHCPYPKLFRRFWKYDPREAALDALDYRINDPEFSANEPEASENARVVRELYLWWVDERDQRIDRYADARIWAGVERRGKNKRKLSLFSDLTDEYRKALNQTNNTEVFYTDQDTAMLAKLMEIRSSLW